MQAIKVKRAWPHHRRLSRLDGIRRRSLEELVDEDEFYFCAFEVTARASGVKRMQL